MRKAYLLSLAVLVSVGCSETPSGTNLDAGLLDAIVGQDSEPQDALTSLDAEMQDGSSDATAGPDASTPPDDATVADAFTPDADMDDAAASDADIEDAAAVDAGGEDAAAADATPQDAEPRDAADAAPLDATPEDAAARDAMPDDAGTEDAMIQDTAPQDAADAETQDATLQDAADAEPQDASLQDAADAEPQDAAAPDATPQDAAAPDAAPMLDAGMPTDPASLDTCADNPCVPGATCIDLAAPRTGFVCGACPAGYIADGATCTRDTAFTVGHAREVTVRDLNGDGILDALVANSLNDQLVVLFGQAGLRFGRATSFPAGNEPRAVLTARLDGPNDTVYDAITVNRITNDVSVFTGDGMGGFAAARSFPVGARPIAAAVGRLNADDLDDLVVASQTGNELSILLGDGTGGFTAATPIALPESPTDVKVADIDDNGTQDVVVSYGTARAADTYVGDGQGNLTAQSSLPFTGTLIAVGHLDADNFIDIALLDRGNDRVRIVRSFGGPGAVRTATITTGDAPADVEMADIDGDTFVDVVVSSQLDDYLAVFRGDGQGGLTESHRAGDDNPERFVLGNFDGTGAVEAIVIGLSARTARVVDLTRCTPDQPGCPCLVEGAMQTRVRFADATSTNCLARDQTRTCSGGFWGPWTQSVGFGVAQQPVCLSAPQCTSASDRVNWVGIVDGAVVSRNTIGTINFINTSSTRRLTQSSRVRFEWSETIGAGGRSTVWGFVTSTFPVGEIHTCAANPGRSEIRLLSTSSRDGRFILQNLADETCTTPRIGFVEGCFNF